MRQWVGAAWRGAGVPCGCADGIEEYPRRTVKGVQHDARSEKDDSGSEHELQPGKAVGARLVGTRRLAGRLRLIRPGGAHRRCLT